MMADTENENVAYTWTRRKLPEGLEPVLQEEEENFVFKVAEPNALVLGGMLLVRTKKKNGE